MAPTFPSLPRFKTEEAVADVRGFAVFMLVEDVEWEVGHPRLNKAIKWGKAGSSSEYPSIVPVLLGQFFKVHYAHSERSPWVEPAGETVTIRTFFSEFISCYLRNRGFEDSPGKQSLSPTPLLPEKLPFWPNSNKLNLKVSGYRGDESRLREVFEVRRHRRGPPEPRPALVPVLLTLDLLTGACERRGHGRRRAQVHRGQRGVP